MKIEQDYQKLERLGVKEKIKCRLSMNSHSFKLLAEQYSNPEKAILQEIGANCADAHSRVGKSNIPWKLTLPGPLDTHIRWRDYGCSMSPEKMKNVYANWMTSDKRDTNNETGCFGIGSKTPLSYTDSFNVTTYLGGKMRMYTICYDEVGEPEINVFGEYDTDEPDGVEVSFAVADKDWKKFETTAKEVYSYFDTPPIVEGVSNYEIDVFDKVMEGDDWFVTNHYYDGVQIIMGNIGYKIDSWEARNKHLSLKNSNLAGIFIKVPVGSVHMTPSREALKYNEFTLNNLQKIFSETETKINNTIQQKLNSMESKYQQLVFSEKLGINGSLSKHWNFKFARHWTVDNVSVLRKFHVINGKAKRSSVDRFPADNPVLCQGVYYVIADESKYLDRKCRILAVDNTKTVSVIENIDKNDFMSKLGVIESDGIVFLASELPDPPKTSRSTGPRGPRKKTKTVKVFCPNANSNDRNQVWESRFWESQEIFPQEDHVYVILDRWDTDFPIKSAYKLCQSLEIPLPTIIGLPSSNKLLYHKNGTKRKNFVHMRAYIYNLVSDYVDEEVLEKCSSYNAFSSIPYIAEFEKLANESDLDMNENSIKKIISFIQDYKKENDTKTKNVFDICRLVGYNLNVPKNEEMENTVNDFRTNYKIISLYMKNHDSYWWKDYDIQAVVDTIKAIDFYNESKESE